MARTPAQLTDGPRPKRTPPNTKTRQQGEKYTPAERADFRDFTDGQHELPERRDPVGPTTGVVMMKLRKAVEERTGEKWHNCLRVRPMDPDDPYCVFQVYARLPDTSTEWQGEYTPDECDDAQIEAIVGDILALRDAANPTVMQAIAAALPPPSESVGAPTPMERRKINLANGDVKEVMVRVNIEKESESQERDRLGREIAKMPLVMMAVDKDIEIGWNGEMYYLQAAEPREVPKPVADIYAQSVRETNKARWRMNVALNANAAQGWIDQETRGPL